LALDVLEHLVQSLENFEMKKTLVALAALAATSVFAQSSVTISGSLDFGVMQNGKTTLDTGAGTAETSTKTSATSALNSWTTNQLSIQGTEDLGGGTKASFTINSGLSQAAAGASTLGSRDAFLTLEDAKAGKVQFGRFVAASALGYHGMSGSASTAVGSLYGLSSAGVALSAAQVDRFGGAAVMTAGDMERGDNKIQYSSVNMNGFTFNVNYAKNTSDASATVNKTQATQSGVGLNYATGPLNLGFGTNTRKVSTENTANTIEGNLNWLAASYDLGAATVYATRVVRKDATTVVATAVETNNFDAKVNQFGVKVPMGQYTIGASFYTGKDKRAANVAADDAKLSGRQLSVQYAMSKRTSLYALSGLNKIARDADAGTAANRKQTVTMVGLLHSF
jgi:predicted porin